MTISQVENAMGKGERVAAESAGITVSPGEEEPVVMVYTESFIMNCRDILHVYTKRQEDLLTGRGTLEQQVEISTLP